MLFGPKPAAARQFYGVAIFLILMGVGTLCTGAIQLILGPFFDDWGQPMEMIIGGLLVIGVGYIVLELELLRNQKKS